MCAPRASTASRGATDFGEYFVYFSFFLVVSALLLVALFFKLGVEQRAREVGLLRAVGFTPTRRPTAVPREGLLLAVVGSALGVVGGHRIRLADHDRPRDVVGGCGGTTALTLHVSWISLAAGAAGGVGGGGRLHLVDAAQSRPHLGAKRCWPVT